MSNLATPGRFIPDLQSAALRAALLKLFPILLATLLVGCATKGGRTSGLEGSSIAGANAAGVGGTDWSGDSSTQGGGANRQRMGIGGSANGRGQTNASVDGRGGAQGMADDDSADDGDDSSLTDGAPGAGKSGGTRGRGRKGKSAGQAGAGPNGASGDKSAGIDSAASGDAAVAGAAGGTKGARAGARRRGGAGVPGPNGESADMNGADDEDSDTQIAAVEVTKGRVQVNEEYQPLTLGGALPVVLGVNEEGRFDFDQYALRPEVRAILDSLSETLKSAEYDRLDILGYTDRIGAADYNRRLSELRAYAVAQYLIRRGVPEYKIRYEGRGDTDPVTRSDECQGLGREELIPCLQKDRRVEIEASIHRKRATVVQ